MSHRLILHLSSAPMPAATRTKRKSVTKNKKPKYKEDSDFEDASELSGRDDASLDSDALDEDTDNDAPRKKRRASPTKKSRSPRKKRKVIEEEYDPSDGEEVYGEVVKAPATGQGT
jgi:hypothetical protein